MPYPFFSTAIRPAGQSGDMAESFTIVINGVRYVELISSWLGVSYGYYKAVDENNITEEEQAYFSDHYPSLIVDGRVYVVGAKAILPDGSVSTEPGCYLGTVRCYGTDTLYVRGNVSNVDSWEYYALGHIPSSYQGGLVVNWPTHNSIKTGADVYPGYAGGVVKSCDSTKFLETSVWSRFGFHSEYQSEYTDTTNTDIYRKYDCLVNALTTKNAILSAMSWKYRSRDLHRNNTTTRGINP